MSDDLKDASIDHIHFHLYLDLHLSEQGLILISNYQLDIPNLQLYLLNIQIQDQMVNNLSHMHNLEV